MIQNKTGTLHDGDAPLRSRRSHGALDWPYKGIWTGATFGELTRITPSSPVIQTSPRRRLRSAAGGTP